jgi:FeS assembly SUF system regulator
LIRITKLTDYGIVLLSHIARMPECKTRSVRDMAAETHLPLPTVSKLLKALTRNGLLISQRGVKGGYILARKPEEITVAQIISALDGPIAITDCSADPGGRCELERMCTVRNNWQRINVAIKDTLESLTLAEMARPTPGFVPLAMLATPGGLDNDGQTTGAITYVSS